MTELFILPSIIRPSIDWLKSIDPVTAIFGDRISTQLPEEDVWPALRIDPAGGNAPVEFRIDQPRLQIQSFALTDVEAEFGARTARAAFLAMNGLYLPGVLCVTDVATSGIQFIEAAVRDAKLLRSPPISHATFSATIAFRSDP